MPYHFNSFTNVATENLAVNHFWKTVLWRIWSEMTAPNGKLRLASVVAISSRVTGFPPPSMSENMAVMCGASGNKFVFSNDNKLVTSSCPSLIKKILYSPSLFVK